VSDVQELQMITVHEANVHVYRTEGNNDDQSSVLKEVFSDEAFVKDNNVCSINSINWARIAAQSTYYVWAYLQVP
jgi:threonine synthase